MSAADGDDGDERGGSVREQDRFLPIANISRIMKKALPPNAKIAKDAKETVQECVSEFISFITSEYVPPHASSGWSIRLVMLRLTVSSLCSSAPALTRPNHLQLDNGVLAACCLLDNIAVLLLLFWKAAHLPVQCHRASDKCQREKRKTINGDDLLWAMSTLGFEEYVEPLKIYLHKFREVRPCKASYLCARESAINSFLVSKHYVLKGSQQVGAALVLLPCQLLYRSLPAKVTRGAAS